jgi:hypothetical protein
MILLPLGRSAHCTVYHATGRRVRNLSIRIEDLL